MIEYIDFELDGSLDKKIKIKLDNKNLIITGANGCGKTRLLNQLDKYLQSFLKRNIRSEATILNEIESRNRRLSSMDVSDANYPYNQHKLKELQFELAQNSKSKIGFTNVEEIFRLVDSNNLIFRFFEANRLANQLASDGKVDSIASIKSSGKHEWLQVDSSDKFEKYLVGYFNYGSHIIAREKDKSKAEFIDEWFKKVEKDLQSLFEDPALALQYSPEEQVFYIVQPGKIPFRFNELSSGYSSILSIYADLLMKVELRDVSADEIVGFVLIDEIDAHLHVSIQRKIFSFFDNAFPKIQFIITTHSPFVVQSVNDAVIYDLSKMECLEDLSMYSYESILKGLLGVDSTSHLLNEQLELMAKLINKRPINKDEVQKVVNLIEPHEARLDSKSKAFLLLGKNALLDANDGEE
ncbi:AAA family ATPase [Aeromonas sp. S12(2024)]|uniref:AAA family ATPase n=1 Tax=Aeromonas sp. S12(2024) TaxID=3242885 RepID=UPI00352853D5